MLEARATSSQAEIDRVEARERNQARDAVQAMNPDELATAIIKLIDAKIIAANPPRLYPNPERRAVEAEFALRQIIAEVLDGIRREA